MGKHTAGDWRIESNEIQADVFAGQMRICEILGWGHLTGALGLSEDEAMQVQNANARLIAAAPDLYQVVNKIANWYEFNGQEDSEIFRDLDAARKKVEGR